MARREEDSAAGRLGAEPPVSERQLARDLGVTRSFMWRAKQVASIPADEFEALVEGDNPPSIAELVALAGERKGRSEAFAATVTVRLREDEAEALDAAIAREPEPRPSRPEMIRRLVAASLTGF